MDRGIVDPLQPVDSLAHKGWVTTWERNLLLNKWVAVSCSVNVSLLRECLHKRD
jgi:hypothetical protein